MNHLSKYLKLSILVTALLLILFVMNTSALMKSCKKEQTTVEIQCKQFYYTLLLIALFVIVQCVFVRSKGMKHYNIYYLLAVVAVAFLSIYLAKIKDVFKCKNQKNLQKYCKLNIYVNFGFIGLLFISLSREILR
tara:strand:- start:985 stop:1389 length:405 start_codon:yes stop_codon:yes gene_type:complete